MRAAPRWGAQPVFRNCDTFAKGCIGSDNRAMGLQSDGLYDYRLEAVSLATAMPILLTCLP